MLDTDAYFARIGYDRAATADLRRSARSMRCIRPRSSLKTSTLCWSPVPLDLAALQAKLVTGRRGGYCFEQNTLFKAVLEALGFSVTSLAARVLWMVPPGAPPNPRAHMVLKVGLPEAPISPMSVSADCSPWRPCGFSTMSSNRLPQAFCASSRATGS